MNICIFSSHYFPYLGGVENYTGHLAQTLTEQGDKVVVVTSNESSLDTYEKMNGIPVFRMPCFNLLDGRFPVSKPNTLFWKIHRRLMKVNFDLIIVQTRFYPHSLYGTWFAKQQNARCIVVDHGTSHMTIGSLFWDKLGAVYEHGITALLKKNCHGFYGVSQNCCQWLRHFGIEPSGTLYNAVDPKEIEQYVEHPVRDFRREYHLSDEVEIITYTGRLVKEKGILNLIEAVENLPKETKAVLMIAGDGDEMEHVKERANERIIPLGRLSLQEVAALLGQTDIYCLPTDYPEGFPTSVLEAAAAGCFVITTKRGGSEELICDRSMGIIMEDNQPATIKNSLMEVLGQKEQRQEAAARAKTRLYEYFTWDKTAEKVKRLWCHERNV